MVKLSQPTEEWGKREDSGNGNASIEMFHTDGLELGEVPPTYYEVTRSASQNKGFESSKKINTKL